MNDNIKKAILIFGVGFVIYFIARPKQKKSLAAGDKSVKEDDPKERGKLKTPVLTPEDRKKSSAQTVKAFDALSAYVAAYNAGEPQDALDELNRELSKEFGMTVYRRRDTGKLAVKDLQGKDIMHNDE